jgi:hypothetical protein
MQKTHNIRDMFNFWVRNERKKKPYLTLKYASRKKNPELWYTVKAEIVYLEKRILELDSEVQKLEFIDKEITRFTAATTEIFEKKKEIFEMKEKLKALRKENPNTQKMLMGYTMFRDIIYSYNKKLVERLVDGEKVNLMEKLGYMYVGKINSRSKLIDWPASNEYKQELMDKGITPKDKHHMDGKNWLIMHDSLYYFRWVWQKRKGSCRVKNNTVYGFYPTGTSGKGVPGVKSILAQANKRNPLLHLKYIVR